MQTFFDTDRYKIKLDNGGVVGHYSMHCMSPVLLNNQLCYLRFGRAAQLAARDLSNNVESSIDFPPSIQPGIATASDGRYAVFAWPSLYGKQQFFYEPQNFAGAIYDSQSKQWISITNPFTQEGNVYPNFMLIADVSSVPPPGIPLSRSIRFMSPTLVEFTSVSLNDQGLLVTHNRLQRTIDLAIGALGPIQIKEQVVGVPSWL